MSDFLTLVSIIVGSIIGVGGIIATVVVYRKQNPRREFSYDVTSSPLVSTTVSGLDKLSISYDGSPLPQPYLVTLEVASTGRADILSSSFDGNRPVVFELGVPIIGETEQTVSEETVRARLAAQEGQTFVELTPSLLPKGLSIRASYLCNGKPKVVPTIELADIPTRVGTRRTARPVWSNVALLALVLLLSVLANIGADVVFRGGN